MVDFKPFPVGRGDALIIVPPFARLNAPTLGPHLLQAYAREAGFEVRVLYANLMLATVIGVDNYMTLCSSTLALIGERFFAASAYDLPPLGCEAEKMFTPETFFSLFSPETLTPERLRSFTQMHAPTPFSLDMPALKRLEAQAAPWADAVAAAVVASGSRVVGCTTMYEQTAASIALLRRVKRLSPQTITIIGGANCEGEMAEGIASLSPALDYIFSGESEDTFVAFLRQMQLGQLPIQRIIYGQPCQHLDDLPPPDFSEFYEQYEQYLPAEAAKLPQMSLLYESSRGCWWGQKHHCTFCGLNGQGMAFRAKSPQKVIDDLNYLLARFPTRWIYMTDNIMPHTYFKTLLPRLAAEVPGVQLFFEEKANLSLEQVLALKQAGVAEIQPGIEALSSSLLKRMDKGVSARQNVTLLRYARSAGLPLVWNLLWAFPGDRPEEYEETLALIRLLRHLQPPTGMYHLSIHRFSPYFDRPADYGIEHVRPYGSYAQIVPAGVDPAKVAYHFTASYPCGSHHCLDLIEEIWREVEAWQAAWQSSISLAPGIRIHTPPMLTVSREAGERWLLRDTRGLPGTTDNLQLTRSQVAAVMTARPFSPSAEITWALERKLGVILDGWYVPLVTAEPTLLREFEPQPKPITLQLAPIELYS
ncbi:MAG: RiPP maturation radical SAM C-methyltransferase [Anaerolineae bacterium]|nr:RiPP maturation radical SAM C-methyltransferase [Anaerolineae bacterium]